MKLQTASWLLLALSQLVTAIPSPYKPICPKDSCMCNGQCRLLESNETCCHQKDGSPEHICGPNQACCRDGCCREGWRCGSNGMCGPPLPAITNPTTIVTMTNSNSLLPTTYEDISGTLPPGSQVPSPSTDKEGSVPGDMPHTTVAGTTGPPSNIPSLGGTPTESGVIITYSDGRVSTIPFKDPSTHTPGEHITPSNIELTIIPPAHTSPSGDMATGSAKESSDLITTVTGTDGPIFTATVPGGSTTGSDTPVVVTKPDTDASRAPTGGATTATTEPSIASSQDQATTAIPTDETSADSDISTNTATSNLNSQESNSIPADAAVSTNSDDSITSGFLSQPSMAETVTTGPGSQVTDTEPPNTSAISETLSGTGPASTDLTSAEQTIHSDPMAITSDMSPTASSDKSDQVTTATEFPVGQITTLSNGHLTTLPSKVTAAPETTVGKLTTLPDGKITTLPKPTNSHITKAPKTTETPAVVISPITTPVPKPEHNQDGIRIPCDMWFFDLCLAPIGGWGIIAPPGIHPPGPPPIMKIDPTAPIKVDITGTIRWPGFTVDPAGNPTFSDKPKDCTTQTAEMCITSTSYGVSIDGTVTSTTATQIVSECGKIYGCEVKDEEASKTITSATTGTSQISTVTAVVMTWEKWNIEEYTDEQLSSIAKAAQSRLDKRYGKVTATTTGATSSLEAITSGDSTTGEAMPTLTRSPDAIPTSSGFSCASTSTYTECGGSGARKACVTKSECASWVNTGKITMTTPEATPICNQGWETYTAEVHQAIPTAGGSLRFYIPTADKMGSDWNLTIGNNDVKEAVDAWKVGNDDEDSIESGKGGKNLEIKWKVPDDSAGTYVDLQFKKSDTKGKISFKAFGGINACMSNCKAEPTTTTDIDGMVCTHYPCTHPSCEQGPAPKPQAACETVEDGIGVPLFYTVTIVANGYSWIDDDGAKLKKEEKGCGAMTDWGHSEIEVETGDGWTARHRFSFTLPITIKAGCVERAIESAGGPSGIQCANKEGDLWL